MGARFGMTVCPSWAETVGDLLQHEAQVQGVCERCSTVSPVDVLELAAARGADFSLLGVKSRCRRPGCRGLVAYRASAGGWWIPLSRFSLRTGRRDDADAVAKLRYR